MGRVNEAGNNTATEKFSSLCGRNDLNWAAVDAGQLELRRGDRRPDPNGRITVNRAPDAPLRLAPIEFEAKDLAPGHRA